MNILGQEQPVIYKMDDIFDPATAQMFLAAQQNYANAVRQDYMQAAQDLKEYNTKYGDFYSPYSKDNLNWDRLVNEPIRKLMQNYGPDMIRSQEGRSMIAQVIASVPGGDLAKLRASALQGINALKVKAELEAKGLYSQDYQDFLDKQAGRTSFKDWDTLKDGVYNSTFSPFQGLGEVTDYIYKGRQPLYKGMKNGQRRYAYDYNDLLNAAQSNAQDFIKTPRGAFEWEIAQRQAAQQNPTASPEQLQKAAYDILDRRIANANMRYLSPDKYEADPFALENYRHNLAMKEAAYKKGLKRRNGSGSGSGSGSEGHSHIGELVLSGWAKRSGYSTSKIKEAMAADLESGTLANMKVLTDDIKHGQKVAIHKNRHNSRDTMLRNMSTTDLKSNIAKSYGVKVGSANGVILTKSDANRLYSAEAVHNSMYGTKKVRYYKGYDKFANSKFYNNDTYEYSMRPTGRVLSVLCKDGKMRMFTEQSIWYKLKDRDYKVKNNQGVETGKLAKNQSSEYHQSNNTLWYDTHVTTKGSGVNVDDNRFIINPQYADDYAPEIEGLDVNIGKAMGDKASRTTEDARID